MLWYINNNRINDSLYPTLKSSANDYRCLYILIIFSSLEFSSAASIYVIGAYSWNGQSLTLTTPSFLPPLVLIDSSDDGLDCEYFLQDLKLLFLPWFCLSVKLLVHTVQILHRYACQIFPLKLLLKCVVYLRIQV